MRMERSAGAVYLEAFLFASMTGAVGAVALIVMGDIGWISAVALGVLIAAVVFVVMGTLLKGTLPPPRGPGNISPTNDRDAVTAESPSRDAPPAPMVTHGAQASDAALDATPGAEGRGPDGEVPPETHAEAAAQADVFSERTPSDEGAPTDAGDADAGDTDAGDADAGDTEVDAEGDPIPDPAADDLPEAGKKPHTLDGARGAGRTTSR